MMRRITRQYNNISNNSKKIRALTKEVLEQLRCNRKETAVKFKQKIQVWW